MTGYPFDPNDDPERYFERGPALSNVEEGIARSPYYPQEQGDPMMLTYGGRITRSSNSFTAPAGGFGFGDNTEHLLLDGPIPINNQTGRPFRSLRVSCLFSALGPISGRGGSLAPTGVLGAECRVQAGSTYGGARAIRQFIIGGGMEVSFELGQYDTARLSIMIAHPNNEIMYQWTDTTAGSATATPLLSQFYTIPKGVIQAVPEGAYQAFFSEAVFCDWITAQFPEQINVLGGAAPALVPGALDVGFDDPAKGVQTTQPVVAGNTPNFVQGSQFRVSGPAGSPFPAVKVQWRLAPV